MSEQSVKKDPSQSQSDLTIEVSLPSRDRLALRMTIENDVIISSRLTGSGCSQLLSALTEWRPKLSGSLSSLPTPSGEDHVSMLLRELILKAQGRWELPYSDEEICHCRAVPTAKVDAAIVGGCHTLSAVSRETSASTSCGACRPDIESLIAYRKGGSVA